MPGVEGVPVVSQLLSLILCIRGDFGRARKTQDNFLHECPGISQVISLGQLVSGDTTGAVETQKRFLGTLNAVANGTPIVGHVKGLTHYALGDKKHGDEALNGATRFTVIIISGAVAYKDHKGIQFIFAGIGAGVAYDIAGTLITGKPQGVYATIKNSPARNILETSSTRSSTPQHNERDCEENEEDESDWEDYDSELWRQWDSILSDYYGSDEEAGPCSTNEEKMDKLKELKEQEPGKDQADAFNYADILTAEEAKMLIQDSLDPNDSSSTDKSTELSRFQLLPVAMPFSFNYTGAVLTNEVKQGLLHSLLRHSSHWGKVIPNYSALVQNIHSIQTDLNDIEGERKRTKSKKLYEAFMKKLPTLSDNDKAALWDLEMMIYEYLLDNISDDNFLGEGINGNQRDGKLQVFFEVKDIQDSTVVMVVCPSTQLYRPNPEIADSRPVRTITTVYFVEERIAEKMIITRKV